MDKIKKNKSNKIKTTGSDRVFEITVLLLIIAFLVLVLYPLIYVLSSSFSSGKAVTAGKVLLWPVNFSIEGYRLVFANTRVWLGYKNTIFYAVVGTMINLILTILAAYPLSRKNFQGRTFFTIFFTIPMFFGGGLIPTYILMSNLGLVNTRSVLLLSGALGIYNMILTRTFFQNSIPNELLESAKMDGISDIGYLFKIVLPLSKAIISVITLYYLVGHWNSYFSAMIYLRNRDLQPLQLILRDILSAASIDLSTISDPALIAKAAGMADVMKYALIVVSSLPMLIIYPFVQKFFEKGVMIGSLKG